MKTTKNFTHIHRWLLVVLAFHFSACKHGENEYHSVIDKIEATSKSYQKTALTSEAYTRGLKTIEITEGAHTFHIPERKSKLTSYACTECHTKSIRALKGAREKKAHWNIKMKHANTNTMNCITCHNTKEMNSLQSVTGSQIDFNKSYKVCAQCHTTQFEDWKGGAHGKKIASWAPPRTSKTCVNCHNPHDPHFAPRWPDKLNTKKTKERQ